MIIEFILAFGATIIAAVSQLFLKVLRIKNIIVLLRSF